MTPPHTHSLKNTLFQACQAALAIEPGWLKAAKELVRALLAAKRHDEAVVKARELLQQNQQDGELHQVCLCVWMCIDKAWGSLRCGCVSDGSRVCCCC